MNSIGRLLMQLRYPWLNSFVSKSMNSPKVKGSLIKRLDKDEMNGIKRLHQLSLWTAYAIKLFVVEQFCWKKSQESSVDENDFEIPIRRLLHVRTLN